VRRFLCLLIVPLGALAAACGSSTPAAAPSTTGASTASTVGGAAGAGADPPYVAASSDLKTEPVVSPGSSPPPTSLQTRDLVVGTGATASAANTVLVQYVGVNYADGKPFDQSTWTQHQPASFSLNQVVPGFAQGIAGMKVGGRREIVIPPALGYGPSGNPPVIKANETLVFVVDLLQVQ